MPKTAKRPARKTVVVNKTALEEEALVHAVLANAPKMGENVSDHDDPDFLNPEEWGSKVSIDSLEGSAYLVVYHRRTREPSVIHQNSLRTVIQKVDPQTGELAFTLTKPTKAPYRGTLKCFLHKDDPDYQYYQSMGLPTCPKANLPNDYNRNLHMQRKHKSAYNVIQEERHMKEQAEEKEFRRLLLAQASKGGV